MAAAAECVFGRTLARRADRARELEVVRPAEETPRQDPKDSPFLHPNASTALAIAATPLEDGPRPVAMVLEDGTVQSLEAPAHKRRFASGTVSGPGWTLWWERRAFGSNA